MRREYLTMKSDINAKALTAAASGANARYNTALEMQAKAARWYNRYNNKVSF